LENRGTSWKTTTYMQQYEKIDLYRRIVQAKLFIDNNYAEPIDLDNIADQAHFSKFHLIRLFRQMYGKTPNNYLVKVRMDAAKSLLNKGGSVLETSTMVGFDSPTSFAGAFKKTFGKSPSVYQREYGVRKRLVTQNPLVAIPNCFAETFGWKNSNFEEVS